MGGIGRRRRWLRAWVASSVLGWHVRRTTRHRKIRPICLDLTTRPRHGGSMVCSTRGSDRLRQPIAAGHQNVHRLSSWRRENEPYSLRRLHFPWVTSVVPGSRLCGAETGRTVGQKRYAQNLVPSVRLFNWDRWPLFHCVVGLAPSREFPSPQDERTREISSINETRRERLRPLIDTRGGRMV